MRPAWQCLLGVTNVFHARLVYAIFRLSCHISLILDVPPALRFEELDLPFPPTNVAWDATDLHWSSVMDNEPPHRTQGPFNFLCTLALAPLTPVDRLKLPGFFTPQDFELGMCAMQSRLWEETQCQGTTEKLSLAQTKYDVKHSQAPGFGHGWPVMLGIWRVTMEQFRRTEARYSAPDCERTSYVNGMTMYHASLIRVHADLPLIRRFAESLCDDTVPSQYVHQWGIQVHSWTRSHGVKEALWHAAQILHLLKQETEQTHSLGALQSSIGPVATECLFRAALIIWTCARSTMVCDLCGPAASIPQDLHGRHYSTKDREQVEVTSLDESSKRYETWLREGARSCIEGVLLCACKLPFLMDKCCNLLKKCTLHAKSVERYVEILMCLQKHP